MSDFPRPIRQANGNPPDFSESSSGPTLTLGDIYYVLFRHKWKIISCSFLGLALAVSYYRFFPPAYQSEAKLFIRYVMENRNPAPVGSDSRVTSPDPRGDTILDSELEIITSADLAGEVVDHIGAEKILGKPGIDHERDIAALVVVKSLTAEVPAKSSIIRLVFQHRNPALVQPILRQLIESYLKKHVEIHRALGITGDFLTQETDQLRSQLAQTEEELQRARSKLGVDSVEAGKKAYTEQIAQLKQKIVDAEADYAERAVFLQEMTGRQLAGTDQEPKTPIRTVAPGEQLADYQQILSRIAQLRAKEQETLIQYTAESTLAQGIRSQISAAEKEKLSLESRYPGLADFASRPAALAQTSSRSGTFDEATATAQLHALSSKIRVWKEQLEKTTADLANVQQMDASIGELRRKKDLEETNYKYYSASLEQARIDEAMGAGHVSNISEIQSPSSPTRDRSKTKKLCALLAAGGIGLGLAWAFAIEMFLDHTVKRPIDMERAVKVPLFISIPELDQKSLNALPAGQSQRALLSPGKASKTEAESQELLAPSNPSNSGFTPDALYPFHETLRDRLIAYFESVNLTHKPKLVAVTGLGNDSGVTTVAAGLAQRLSETDEGNVLLVDMTAGNGSSQQFFKGKPVRGLDELLQTREDAAVQDKLYVVNEGSNSEKLSRNLPQRFTKLVPKLKASDFDYIIFDMPPMSQISVTPRLASFMDMVLLVVESEKTDRHLVQQATALLAEAKTHVGMVLNKTRNYVPKQLYRDSLNGT